VNTPRLLPFPLLAAMAIAQVPQPGVFELRMADGQMVAVVQRVDMTGALFLANAGGAIQVLVPQPWIVLRDPVTLGAVLGTGENEVAMPLGAAADVLVHLDVWVQALTIDAGGRVQVHAPLRARDWVGAQGTCGGGIPPRDALPPALRDVEFEMLWLETNPPQLQLAVRFTARSDGYDLRIVKVRRLAGLEPVDEVRIHLKTPHWPDEGMLDIEQQFVAVVNLGVAPAQTTRIVGATTDTRELPDPVNWFLMAELPTRKP